MNTLICGDVIDVLRTLPEKSVQTCITSTPYYRLRDYGKDQQIGMESTPEHFVQKLSQVFCEVWRVLKDDGTLWLNLGDSYNGSGKGGVFTDKSAKQRTNTGANVSKPTRLSGLKNKDLIGIPWMVAFALRADGWYLRSDIIWAKPNPMPESVKDRPTRSHEYIFLLSKSAKYYYDSAAIAEPAKYPKDLRAPNSGYYNSDGSLRVTIKDGQSTRNKRDVWTVTPKPYKEAHFAVFPPALITPCILAGSREGDTVLDPFVGSGTTLLVASQYNRNGIGIDLNQDYIDLAEKRLAA